MNVNVKVSEEIKTILKNSLCAYLANPLDLAAIQNLKDALLCFGEAVAGSLPRNEQMIIDRASFDNAVNLAVAEIGLTFVDKDVPPLTYFSDLVYKDLLVADEKTGGPKNKNTIINQVATELLNVSARLPISPKMESKKSQWKEELAALSKALINPDYKIKDGLSVIEGSIDTFFNRREYLDSVQFASFLQRKLNQLQDIEDQLEEAEKGKIVALKKVLQSEYDALRMHADPVIKLTGEIYGFRRYGRGLVDSDPDKNKIKSAVYYMDEAVKDFVSMPKVCRDDIQEKNKFFARVEDAFQFFEPKENQFCDEKIKKDNCSSSDENIAFWKRLIMATLKQLVNVASALVGLSIFRSTGSCKESNATKLFDYCRTGFRGC